MIAGKYSKGLLDFHTHTTHSDGGDTPSELVRKAKEQGITALALTDHHTADGLPEFRKACEIYDVFGIPFGTEISAELPKELLIKGDNEAPDMVLLGKNVNEAPLKEYKNIYFDYVEQVFLPQTLEKLRKEGFEIPNIDIKAEVATCHCPPDILMNFTNHSDNLDRLVKYVQERDSKAPEDEIRKRPFGFAVNFLYSVDCPAYVQRAGNFNVDDAVGLADSMNCGLFIAHPGGDFGSLRKEILDYFVSRGVKGMEIRNYFNSPEQNSFFDKYVEKHSLIRSGGSDYHGDQKTPQLGMRDRPQNQLSKEVLEEVVGNLPS